MPASCGRPSVGVLPGAFVCTRDAPVAVCVLAGEAVLGKAGAMVTGAGVPVNFFTSPY